MSEIYWITRLSAINGLFIAMMICALVASGISLIAYIVNYCDEISTNRDSDKEEARNYKKLFMKLLKWFGAFAFVGVLGTVFIPTTKQALLILGVGGTIDYIKANPTAKQIPDKCINALDKWVESLSNDSIDSKKKSE